MGNSLKSLPLINRCYHETPPTFIIEGLDAAGKTSLLYRIKNPSDEIVTTIPTIGFNLETVGMGKLQMIAYDVGGRNKTLSMMTHQILMEKCDSIGFCFVIDSTDAERFEEAGEHLLSYFQRHKQYTDFQHNIRSILILANKQDLPDARPAGEIIEKLNIRELERLTCCPICVLGCSVKCNTGIKEAVEWMSYSMTNFHAIQRSLKNAALNGDQKVANLIKKSDSRSIKMYFEYAKQLLMS